MLKNIFGRFLHFIAYIIPFGSSLRPLLHKWRGVKIGNNVWISKFVYIDENHPECISIGDNSTIGFRTTIFAHTYFGIRQKNYKDKIEIGNNVFIGPHCLILPNVKIGDGAVIKGGSTISRNIPPNTLIGPPDLILYGKVTIPLTNEHTYNEFVEGLQPIRKKESYSN